MTKIFGFNIDDLIKVCDNPITLCRLGILKLALESGRRAENKRLLLEKIIELVNRRYEYVKPLIEEHLNTLENALQQLFRVKDRRNILRLKARALTRLLVHTKNDNTSTLFEYGTILHPIFSVPYIPGSSLKGPLRSYLENLSSSLLTLDDINDLLGSTEQASSVIITDAYLTRPGENGRIIEPEVTTPIYRESPMEHEASPVPIVYPAVARGAEFTFIVVVKNKNIRMLDDVKGWIVASLSEGVGAKTMLGYGVLEVSA